jgi:hypothetical protein
MALHHRSKPVPFGRHAREIVGQFLKIELLLVAEFQDSFMSLSVCDEGL